MQEWNFHVECNHILNIKKRKLMNQKERDDMCVSMYRPAPAVMEMNQSAWWELKVIVDSSDVIK
jgi:hypothetical protein